jgi:ATP-dependent helicase HepA
LAQTLRKAFKSEGAVAEFCATMGLQEKEEAVARFRKNPKTWLLVSDESGGEGRNFQFASELIHFDNPWNIARIEQRIGRLDRLGREEFSREVTSVVVHATGTSEEGLVTVARDALGVYAKSISGLEFGLRQIDDQVATAACADEPLAALQALVPTIREAATAERARDDGDAVLDEASYERKAANRYLRLATAQDSGQALESAFTRYFEYLAPKGVTKCQDDAGNALLCFDTHRVSGDALTLPQQASSGDGRFRGAFDRKVAQVTPGQQFFQVGNPLFDAVMESAMNRPNGRTYAVECTIPKFGAWRGFEFSFRPAVNAAGVADAWAFAQRASSALDALPIHVFVSADGAVGPDELLDVRLGLAKRRKNLDWIDLSERPKGGLLNAFGEPWSRVVRACHQVAVQVGRKVLKDRLDATIQAELVYLMDLERGATPERDPAANDLIDKVKRYRAALLDWEPVLDGVGFLSVNSPL